MTLTHLNARGEAHMVDVADKRESRREARARGCIHMQPATLALLLEGGLPKGDVLATARIAGILAAKRTHELIPLCHALPLSKVSVDFDMDEAQSCVHVEAMCRLNGRTGVEMEALTAVSVACLTLYDMCKAVDKGMTIDAIRLEEKSGGRSGDWSRSTSLEETDAKRHDGFDVASEDGEKAARDNNTLTIRFLAELRERLGQSEMSLACDRLTSRDVAGVKRALIALDPRFSVLEERRVLAARNQVMVNDTTAVDERDEIAFFPPVTGG